MADTKKLTTWRKFLQENYICLADEGNAPCDHGIQCTFCLRNDIFEEYKKYKEKLKKKGA